MGSSADPAALLCELLLEGGCSHRRPRRLVSGAVVSGRGERIDFFSPSICHPPKYLGTLQLEGVFRYVCHHRAPLFKLAMERGLGEIL